MLLRLRGDALEEGMYICVYDLRGAGVAAVCGGLYRSAPASVSVNFIVNAGLGLDMGCSMYRWSKALTSMPDEARVGKRS